MSVVKRRVTRVAAVGVVVLNLALLSSCTDKVSEPFRDAPRGGTNSAPMDVIEMSDGFSNVGTKCDHGNRIYVVFKGDAEYGAIAVVTKDPTC
jgi:hypothetical protein